MATNANTQNITIDAQVGMGLQNMPASRLLYYEEPSTTTAKFADTSTIVIPPNTVDQVLNLATLFPGINTALVFVIADITSSPGVPINFGMAAGGARFNMAAMGFFVVRVNGSAPTLYLDNPSLTQNGILQVSVLAN